LSHILSEVDITDSLLHHEVDRVDGVLDVLGFGPEDVANSGHTVALLRLPDILQIVHQPSDLHLLFVFCVIEFACGVTSSLAELRIL